MLLQNTPFYYIAKVLARLVISMFVFYKKQEIGFIVLSPFSKVKDANVKV